MKTIKVRDTIGWHTRSSEFSDEFQSALDSGEEIQIHINSPGGSVYQGWEISNEIRMAIADGAEVSTYNLGLAASIATPIFLSAKRENRYMAKNSMFMIHNPSGLAFGDKEEMRKEMELLDKIEDILASDYADVTNTEEGYMKVLMSKTTWFKPSEAKQEGFFDKIIDREKEPEDVAVVGMDKSAFGSIPTNCSDRLRFDNASDSIKEEEPFEDLTKISNSQIREKIWKNCLKH